MRGLTLLALLPMAAAAQDRPPTDYFTGVYERVGRTADTEPGLLNDLVRLAPDPGGQGLLMTTCAPAGAPGTAPLLLRFDTFGEVGNLLSSDSRDPGLFCEYFNDAGNYPILACGTNDLRGRYTLWAVTDNRAAACAP